MQHLLHAFLLLAAPAGLLSPATAQYETLSKSTGGVIADEHCGDLQMSGDGRFVVFSTKAGTLVAGDANGYYDVYLRDTLLGTTERISQGLAGAEPDGDCRWPAVSDDGRWVVFGSGATNLVSGDANGAWDAFRHDRTTGTTVLCSITHLGLQTLSHSADRDHSIDVSDDGNLVAFESLDDTLVSEFTGGATRDLYVRDVAAGITTLVSIATGDWQSSGGWRPSVDATGSLVTFTSNDFHLHVDDPDGNDDVFAWHAGTRVIELVSRGPSGSSGSSPGNSKNARISPDGRWVVFESTCADLDPADPHLDSDVFLRDRVSGSTEVVSLDADGLATAYTDCSVADVSADGRYVAFQSNAPLTGVVHSPYYAKFVYLRDRTAATTEFVTIPRWWWPGTVVGGGEPHVTDDGSSVTFRDDAPYQESPSSVDRPIVRRERDGVTNLMSLTCYDAYAPGMTMTLTAYDAEPSAPFWVLRSAKATGFAYQGHEFDLGAPITPMGGGASDATGKCLWTSAPIPAAASGKTIQLEIASKSGAVWRD